MSHIKLPSADLLLAEVLSKHCGSLAYKVSQGETQEVGIFHLRNKDTADKLVSFMFEMNWQFDEGKPYNFHIQIHHIRPRSNGLVVDRVIKNL